jgi:hypothetical protein
MKYIIFALTKKMDKAMETKKQNTKRVPTLKKEKVVPKKRVSKIIQAAKKYQGSVEILDMDALLKTLN